MGWISTETKKEQDEMKKAIFAIDFDGTIVEHEYPALGAPNPGAVEVLRELMEKGYRLILFTMRSGTALDEAIRYCNQNKVDFWAVNQNPEQAGWTDSNKVYANVYIDDAALGVPLVQGNNAGSRARVDWAGVRRILVDWGVLEAVKTEANDESIQRVKDL
jgi:hypothetical protein